jgi:hypothetical protein
MPNIPIGDCAKPNKTAKVFKVEHSGARGLGHYFRVMPKELNPKQVLAVECPTCGAAPGEKCELSTGQPRTNAHRDRRLIAKDGSV